MKLMVTLALAAALVGCTKPASTPAPIAVVPVVVAGPQAPTTQLEAIGAVTMRPSAQATDYGAYRKRSQAAAHYSAYRKAFYNAALANSLIRFYDSADWPQGPMGAHPYRTR